MSNPQFILPTRNVHITTSKISRYSHILLFLAIPFFFLAIDQNWIFNSPYVDTWVYLGFFRHFPDFQSELFRGTYYGNRLPWILPGFLAHSFLPPVAANHALHLAFYYLALFSLYSVVKRTVNARAALLSTLFLAGYGHFLDAVGWDYTDGACVAYYLLTIALLTKAAEAERPPAWLIASGTSFAALIYTNIAWLILSPTFVLYHLLAWRRFKGKISQKDVFRNFQYLFIGIFLLTMLLGAINVLFGGEFWFFRPAFTAAFAFGDGSRMRSSVLEWLPNASWLVMPSLTSLAGIIFLFQKNVGFIKDMASNKRLFVVNYLLFWGLMIIVQYRNFPMLHNSTYAVFLTGPMFLVIGALFQERLDELTLRQTLALISGIVVFHIVHMFCDFPENISLAIILGAIGFALVIVRLHSRHFLFVSVLFILLAQFFSYEKKASYFNSYYGALPPPLFKNTANLYQRVIQGMRYVDQETQGRKPRFWYDLKEPLGVEFRSLASVYLYMYNLINDRFPDPDLSQSWAVPPYSLIVIPSQQEKVFIRAQEAMRKNSLELRLVGQREISDGNIRYNLTFAEVEPPYLGKEPVQLSFDENGGMLAPVAEGDTIIPLDKWSACSSQENMKSRLTAEGLEIETVESRWGYATSLPLTAQKEGEYYFALQYRPIKGELFFGALSQDKSQWVARADEAVRLGDIKMRFLSIRLKASDQIILMTTNNNPHGSHSSSYIIEEVKVYLLD